MSIQARAIVLVLLLLWQSLTGLSAVSLDEQHEVLAHALVHGLAADHHHHVDELQHAGDLQSPEEHQHVHDGLQTSAMPLAPWYHLMAVNPAAPTVLAMAKRPPVFLEGPLRPPQSLS